MITIPASDTIAGVASAATEVTCTLFLMELHTGTGAETYTKDQQQLASSVATIYTATGNGPTFVKSIHVVNTDTANSNTFQLFVGGTAAANAITPVMTIVAGGSATYEDGTGWQFHDTSGKLLTVAGTGTSFSGGTITTAVLTSNAAANSTTTGVEVHSIAISAAGTYVFEWTVLYESAATSTGVSFGINYTGTAAPICGWMEYPATGTSAATAAASMVATGATGQIHESFGFRAESTTAPNMGATASVDAASPSVMMCVVRGAFICSDTGDLELWHASEVAASSTVRAGTSVIVYRTN